MTRTDRERFDILLEAILETLPPRLHKLLDEAPLIVEDRPSPDLMLELGIDEEEILCGLHTGTPLTERSVELADEPETIHLFRDGIVEHAGGWHDEQNLVREIRITLLHEIGHHFGLEEKDLTELGYE